MRKLAVTLLFCVSTFAFSQEEFTSTQIKQYKSGIFEVVTLKSEDKTEYAEEFPHELIPFQFRNDKYHSVGTAFLIDDKTFASAAHVFSVGSKSLLSKNYALRDTDGNILEITDVQKFSNYRDIIQFEVKQDTSNYHTFTLAPDKNEEGDTIYAAGNALGEGVIFRKGTLTSYTFEPVDGKWKNIRFSAAASPGNSGGPLLNLQGEVVGVVTMKSENENLNHAFPIREFVEFTDKYAEFFDKQIGEVESTKRLMFGWDFKSPLPQNILKLRAIAEQNLLDRMREGRAEFLAKYGSDLFPQHPKSLNFIKNQSGDESLAIVDVNGNGEWSLFTVGDEQRVKITNKQSLWFGRNENMLGSYQFFLEKPEKQTLTSFLSNPKQVLDTFLVSVKWNRNIANTPVYITSYGDPVETEVHTDIYGRHWHMASWQDTYSDQGVMIYCLPIPQGVACDLVITSNAGLAIQKQGYKDNLHRIMLSYTAKLSEWQEFLSLPKNFVPTFFQESTLALSEQTTEFSLGEFSGSLANLSINDDSNIYAAMEISPSNIKQLVVGYLSFQPELNEDTLFSLSKFYDLGESGSETYTDSWNKFVAQESPYDYTVNDEGETLTKQMNLGAVGKSPFGFVAADSGIGYLAKCEIESTDGPEELTRKCDQFIDGLTIQ